MSEDGRHEAGMAAANGPPRPRRPDDQRSRPAGPWEGLIGQDVVIDTDSSFIYVGRLEGADDHFIALSTADVHDMRDSQATKEIYVLEAMKYGLRANRKLVYVARRRVVSVSLLDDVVHY